MDCKSDTLRPGVDREERMNDFLFVSVSDVDDVLEEYFLSGLKQNKITK